MWNRIITRESQEKIEQNIFEHGHSLPSWRKITQNGIIQLVPIDEDGSSLVQEGITYDNEDTFKAHYNIMIQTLNIDTKRSLL